MRKNIDVKKKPTQKQIAVLGRASSLPVPSDAEYPEFSEAELLQFKRISAERKSGRQKQTVTLRLSPQAVQRARSLGKGYTSVLSRILENALQDAEVIRQNL